MRGQRKKGLQTQKPHTNVSGPKKFSKGVLIPKSKGRAVISVGTSKQEAESGREQGGRQQGILGGGRGGRDALGLPRQCRAPKSALSDGAETATPLQYS